MAEGQYRYVYRCCRSQTPAGVIWHPSAGISGDCQCLDSLPCQDPLMGRNLSYSYYLGASTFFPEHLGSPDSLWSKDWKIRLFSWKDKVNILFAMTRWLMTALVTPTRLLRSDPH